MRFLFPFLAYLWLLMGLLDSTWLAPTACNCTRCCCCPRVLAYPETLTVHLVIPADGIDTTFTISGVYCDHDFVTGDPCTGTAPPAAYFHGPCGWKWARCISADTCIGCGDFSFTGTVDGVTTTYYLVDCFLGCNLRQPTDEGGPQPGTCAVADGRTPFPDYNWWSASVTIATNCADDLSFTIYDPINDSDSLTGRISNPLDCATMKCCNPSGFYLKFWLADYCPPGTPCAGTDPWPGDVPGSPYIEFSGSPLCQTATGD